MRRSKKRIIFLLALILILFFGLILFLTGFQIIKADEYKNSSINMRNWVNEAEFGRGLFLDRNGYEITDRTKNEDGTYSRSVKHPRMYSHVIGYNSQQYGKSSLEASYNTYLLNIQDNPISKLRGQILGKGLGNNIQLTIDNDLQYLAYSLLDGRKGAVVALDPRTGEVLAMVSLPSFNVNTIDQDWNYLIESTDSPLYNRATRGLYAPGSTMKAITGISFLEADIDLDYVDEGVTTIDGYTYSNYNQNVYGPISLREALIYSSNVYFADKSQEVSGRTLQNTVDRFYFNKEIPFDVGTEVSRAIYFDGMDANEKAANSFGQGTVLASPLQMALAYGAIANDGIMMEPSLVKAIISPSGSIIQEHRPKELSRVASNGNIRLMQSYLSDTMIYSESQAQIPNYQVAGKTGTAETSDGSINAWYCGYAPAENPEIAIAVIVENSTGTGGQVAAPIAGDLFNYWLNQ